jgi:hypothetical protein
MTVEDRVRDALRAADDYPPSSDLFVRVQRSIEEDQAHRTRLLRILGVVALWLLALGAWFLLTVDADNGGSVIPWWSLEVAANFVMVSFIVVMGPLIWRFGEGYAGAVFGTHPVTGDRFLRLIDVAYYLALTAYVLITAQVEPVAGSLGELLGRVTPKVAGLFLLAGVLHGLTILVLPFIGLVFSSSWRRAERAALGAAAGSPDPAAERADRVVRIVIWVGIGIVGLFTAFQVLSLIATVIGLGVG